MPVTGLSFAPAKLVVEQGNVFRLSINITMYSLVSYHRLCKTFRCSIHCSIVLGGQQNQHLHVFT
jgi:hypothetical protein